MSFVPINHAPDGAHTSAHKTATAALAAMLGRSTDDGAISCASAAPTTATEGTAWSWRSAAQAIPPSSGMSCAPSITTSQRWRFPCRVVLMCVP